MWYLSNFGNDVFAKEKNKNETKQNKKTVRRNIKVHLDKHRQAAMFRCSSCDKNYKYIQIIYKST